MRTLVVANQRLSVNACVQRGKTAANRGFTALQEKNESKGIRRDGQKGMRLPTAEELDRKMINKRFKRPYARKCYWWSPFWNPAYKLQAYLHLMNERFERMIARIEEMHSTTPNKGSERVRGDKLLEAEVSLFAAFTHTFSVKNADGREIDVAFVANRVEGKGKNAKKKDKNAIAGISIFAKYKDGYAREVGGSEAQKNGDTRLEAADTAPAQNATAATQYVSTMPPTTHKNPNTRTETGIESVAAEESPQPLQNAPLASLNGTVLPNVFNTQSVININAHLLAEIAEEIALGMPPQSQIQTQNPSTSTQTSSAATCGMQTANASAQNANFEIFETPAENTIPPVAQNPPLGFSPQNLLYNFVLSFNPPAEMAEDVNPVSNQNPAINLNEQKIIPIPYASNQNLQTPTVPPESTMASEYSGESIPAPPTFSAKGTKAKKDGMAYFFKENKKQSPFGVTMKMPPEPPQG